MKAFLKSIGTHAKDHAAKYIGGGIVLIAITICTWGFNIFKTGLKVEADKRTSELMDSLLIRKFRSPQYMSTIMPIVMKSKEVITFAKETQEKVIRLTEKDSIQLSAELRVKMDLRESESVSEEVGWMYTEVKIMKKQIDSLKALIRPVRSPMRSY